MPVPALQAGAVQDQERAAPAVRAEARAVLRAAPPAAPRAEARAVPRAEARAVPAAMAREAHVPRTALRDKRRRGARDAGGERDIADGVAVDVEGEEAGARPASGRRARRPQFHLTAGEVVYACLQKVVPRVDGPESADQVPARPGLERDDLEQTVVEPRHRGYLHAAAEGLPVADGDGVRVQRQFAAQALRVYEAAGELDPPAGDDGAQRRLRVGEAAAEERRGGRRVPVHEAAEARREHVLIQYRSTGRPSRSGKRAQPASTMRSAPPARAAR